MRKTLFVLAVLLSFASLTNAAVYHVNGSTSSVVGAQGVYGGGNDSTGNGTLAFPWATMYKANSIGAGGDTVYVAAGTYVETNNNASPYCLNTINSVHWIADGSVTVQSSAAASRALNLTGANAISFNGFTFDSQSKANGIVSSNSGTSVFTNCYIINATNQSINYSGDNNSFNGGGISQIGGISVINDIGINLAILNQVWTLSGTFTSSLWSCCSGTANKTLSDSTIDFTGTMGSSAFYFYGGLLTVSIIDNKFSFSNTLGSNYAFLDIRNQINPIISNNTIISSGVNYPTKIINIQSVISPTISKNTVISHSPSSVFYLQDVSTPVISENSVVTTNTGNSDHYVLVSTGPICSTATIANNTSYTQSAYGHVITVGWDADPGESLYGKLDGVIIDGNKIFGPSWYLPAVANTVNLHGILVGYNKNAIIRNNYVNGALYHTVLKHAGQNYVQTSGGIINNTAINCGSAGGTGGVLYVKGLSGAQIMHNTIWSDPSLPNQPTYGIIFGTNEAGQYATNGQAMFNVVQIKHGIYHIYADPDSPGLVSDYNTYWSDDGTAKFGAGGSDYVTFSAWKTAGYDSNGRNENPKLVNPAAGDVRTRQIHQAGSGNFQSTVMLIH